MLPNLFVIGAAKAGTTSLHEYLDLHPEIHMARIKETHFFAPEDAVFRWGRVSSRAEYEALFDSPAPVLGEASPSYSQYPRYAGVPERIVELIPDARFLYIVRDPIDRIKSLYLLDAKYSPQPPPLHEAIGDLDDPCNKFICGSRYMTQIARYLAVFPAERILVVDHAALRDQRGAELARIFEFLSVDPGYWNSEFRTRHNATADVRGRSRAQQFLLHKRVRTVARIVPRQLRTPLAEKTMQALSRPLPKVDVTPALRVQLEQRLHTEVQRLREFAGQDFANWSV